MQNVPVDLHPGDAIDILITPTQATQIEVRKTFLSLPSLFAAISFMAFIVSFPFLLAIRSGSSTLTVTYRRVITKMRPMRVLVVF